MVSRPWPLAYAASMAERLPSQSSTIREIVISLPFTGLWLARNSPARRVPSHGTDLLGERYAIDFIAVDHRRRTADRRDWWTFLATEPAERFFAYGRPILAPADGIVVDVHDGEIDHVGRRSQLTLVPYALGQLKRLRQGVGAVAGNYLIIALRESGTFVFASPSARTWRRDSRSQTVGTLATRPSRMCTCRSWIARTCPGPEASRWRFGASANGHAARNMSRSGSSAFRPRVRSSKRPPYWRRTSLPDRPNEPPSARRAREVKAVDDGALPPGAR